MGASTAVPVEQGQAAPATQTQPAESSQGYPRAPENAAAPLKKCATEGCDFAVTWHATHCCHACEAGGLHKHGGRCEKKQLMHCPTEGCRFLVTFHPTHCCEPCKQGRGHGPKCEQALHRLDKCQRWFCGRLATWHPTHCCEGCKQGKDHGLQCKQPASSLSRFQLSNSSPLTECRPTEAGGNFASLTYAKAVVQKNKEVDLSLDLRLPTGPGPFPCVVFVHGGAWVHGNFQGFTTGPFGQLLCQLGWACASVQYRFLQDAPWPAAECDVRAAVRLLRMNSAQLRLDPERFVSMGHSAGGHLAGFLAAAAADLGAEDDLRHVAESESSTVQGIIGYAGAFDGNRFMRDGNLVKRAQESSSRDGWPPMLLIQGTADSMVPKKTAQDMAQALRAVEADVRLLFLEGHYHQFQLNAPAADAIATFLSKFTA